MGLSPLQLRVAQTFFALAESSGFTLGGGGALIVQRLVERTTADLDLFSAERAMVTVAADALRGALVADGLACHELRRHVGFVRVEVRDGDERTEVDLALDPPWRDAVATEAGPARSSEELAVDKLLALFGRAEARDFVDVFALAGRHGIDRMLEWAPEKDAGFSPYRLADALGRMVQLDRGMFQVDDATYQAMIGFYADLRARLIARTVGGE
ncbi:MAG: nucleotidyl transferase AbiEii/AbiGii toxin family protein [Acidimicrobiia bacterium]|nr:nucleotidyl transferase AbiEii/AbiGii toxin family protein [Acidimicrobiia bacterium]